MITHEDLVREYEKQLLRKDLGSKPVRMFDENGKFNKNNWNGGDSNLIRNFLDNVKDNYCFKNEKYQRININKIYKDDMTYVFITENIIHECNEYINDEIVTNSYIIAWYKNRGRIELFLFDNFIGDEDDYIDLLNMLDIKIED